MLKRVDLIKIKQLRKKSKISLIEMAEFLGYESSNGYYYLEIGRGTFSAENLAKVADIFGVAIEELFFDDGITKLATK